MPGVVETSRVATNVSGRTLTYDAKGVIRQGGHVDFGVAVALHAVARTLDPPADRDQSHRRGPGQYFGQILLDQVGRSARPAPAGRVQPPAGRRSRLTSKCGSSTLIVRHGEACTIRAQNNNSSPVAVDLHTIVSGMLLRVTGVDGAARIDDQNVTLSDAALRGKTPGTPAIAPGTPSGGGYLDLATLGATPEVVGDEDALNVTLPTPFKYAGDQWDTIGLTSDGYAVVGGATSQDIQFVPQTLPDPVPPNNVLAPYWTDTTGDDAPGIYAEVHHRRHQRPETGSWPSGTSSWSPEVPPRRSNSGSASTGPRTSPTRMTLPVRSSIPGSSLGLTVGAENFNGSGGAQISGLPTAGSPRHDRRWRPRGEAVLPCRHSRAPSGPGRVVTVLSSPAQQGDTVVVSKVKVVPRPG